MTFSACEVCSSPLNKLIYNSARFCSRSCQGRFAGKLGGYAKNYDPRRKITISCEVCGTETLNLRFCSKSCSAKVTNRESPRRKRLTARTPGTCTICGGVTGTYDRKYCSRECLSYSMRPSWHQDWLDNKHNPATEIKGYQPGRLRTDLIKLRGAKCEQCGWAEVNPVSGCSPIEMDHIDGDPSNNFISNLRLLCPNCHSLTPTYRYLNTPRSRAKRGLPPL